jgi:hypothetical protein
VRLGRAGSRAQPHLHVPVCGGDERLEGGGVHRSTPVELHVAHTLAGALEQPRRILERRAMKEADVHVGAEGVDVRERGGADTRGGVAVVQELANVRAAAAHRLEPGPSHLSQRMLGRREPAVDVRIARNGARQEEEIAHRARMPDWPTKSRRRQGCRHPAGDHEVCAMPTRLGGGFRERRHIVTGGVFSKGAPGGAAHDVACAKSTEAGKTPDECRWDDERGAGVRLAAAVEKERGSPAYWRAKESESANCCFGPSTQQLREARRELGDFPVLILARSLSPYAVPGQPQSPRNRAGEDIHDASLELVLAHAPKGEMRVVPNTSHLIQIEQPKAVSDAIIEQLEKVRATAQEQRRRRWIRCLRWIEKTLCAPIGARGAYKAATVVQKDATLS